MNKETKFLHFEDNEVSEINADGEVLKSKQYKTQKAAKQVFDEQVHALNVDENYRIEFVFYQPEFPPQRLEITRK